MNQIAIVLALCMGAWYFFVGGRKQDEPMVRLGGRGALSQGDFFRE